MMKDKDWLNEELALKEASKFLNELPMLEKKREALPLNQLRIEKKCFRESMVLQIAGFILIAGNQPFEDKNIQAALLLAVSNFDHLWQGWNCIIKGYYGVAQTLLRRIFEGIIYEMGVVLDPKIGNDWWSDKLGPGTVPRSIIPLIEKKLNDVNTGAGTTYAQHLRTGWKELNKLIHSNYRAIGTMTVLMPTKKDDSIPRYTFGGGTWNSKLCKGLCHLYARYAIEATVNMGWVFAQELINAKKWNKRCYNLITKGLRKDLKL